MNNHATCFAEDDFVAIDSSVFTYFHESIMTPPERSIVIPRSDLILRLIQERANIFKRYSETITKLTSDNPCAFLLKSGGILRLLQKECQDINRQIEDAYSQTS